MKDYMNVIKAPVVTEKSAALSADGKKLVLKVAKDANKSKRLQNVIYHLLEAIRVCSLYLEPFMPGTSNEIRKQLNISDVVPSYNASNEYHLNTPIVLFQRIDRDKFFEEHVK